MNFRELLNPIDLSIFNTMPKDRAALIDVYTNSVSITYNEGDIVRTVSYRIIHPIPFCTLSKLVNDDAARKRRWDEKRRRGYLFSKAMKLDGLVSQERNEGNSPQDGGPKRASPPPPPGTPRGRAFRLAPGPKVMPIFVNCKF